MASITDLRTSGTTLIVNDDPILEPINAPEDFRVRLERFGDHYNTTPDSHLYKFLLALCGEAGAGALKKSLLYPKLQSMLESTYFNDLDRLYGSPLGLPRLSEEIYVVDPRNDILTEDQWADVRSKDAQYRARCLIWMRAIVKGPTLEGIALAAEAAIGIEADVFERYKYVENAASDSPITVSNLGQTNSRNEFVIVPRTPTLTASEEWRILHLVDRLRPVNTLPTVTTGDYLRSARGITDVSSTSDGFVVQRFVTGRPDINWPNVDPAKGFWITKSETEMPNFAFMSRQQSVTYPTIVGATASTEHIGPFNAMQQNLFGHLQNLDSYEFYSAKKSYAQAIAPISITIPWTASS